MSSYLRIIAVLSLIYSIDSVIAELLAHKNTSVLGSGFSYSLSSFSTFDDAGDLPLRYPSCIVPHQYQPQQPLPPRELLHCRSCCLKMDDQRIC